MDEVIYSEKKNVHVALKAEVSKEAFEKFEIMRENIGEYERCGLLFGKLQRKSILIFEMVEIENVKRSPVEFELNPVQALKAFESAEEKDLEVVGVWHTHPLWIAHPSQKDRKGMEIYPGLWIIISKSEIRAYFGDEKGFEEVFIEIMEPPQ